MNIDEELDRRDFLDSNKCIVTAFVSFGARGRTGWKGVSPFLEELCDKYGDVCVLKRLTSTYLQYQSLDESERRALLFWTPRLMNSARFYPHFKTTGALAAVKAAYDYRMEELESRGDTRMEMETVNALGWTA